MNKKIKLLIEKSKTKDKLDPHKIGLVAGYLSRGELKEYLFLLKRSRISEQVFIETPIPLYNQSLLKLKRIFKGKEIVVSINKDLIGGIRISLLDTIFDLSVKGMLEKVKQGVWQT